MRRLVWILVVLFSLAAVPVFAGPSQQASTKKAEGKTGIEWNVTPANVVVFLDGKKLGAAGDLAGKLTKADPGKHTIKLTKDGDEQEMDVKVVKGQVLRIDFEFSDG
jgi:hypothetical protein